MIVERRNSPRVDVDIQAKYLVKEMFKDAEYSCMITDISDDGLGIQAEVADSITGSRPKGNLKPGHSIHLVVEDMNIACKIIYVEMSNVGLKFESIKPEELNRLNNLKNIA